MNGLGGGPSLVTDSIEVLEDAGNVWILCGLCPRRYRMKAPIPAASNTNTRATTPPMTALAAGLTLACDDCDDSDVLVVVVLNCIVFIGALHKEGLS